MATLDLLERGYQLNPMGDFLIIDECERTDTTWLQGRRYCCSSEPERSCCISLFASDPGGGINLSAAQSLQQH